MDSFGSGVGAEIAPDEDRQTSALEPLSEGIWRSTPKSRMAGNPGLG